jgi:hypothetical protein
VHKLRVGNGLSGVVQEGARHKALQPLLAVVHLLLAEGHLQGQAIHVACGRHKLRMVSDAAVHSDCHIPLRSHRPSLLTIPDKLLAV